MTLLSCVKMEKSPYFYRMTTKLSGAASMNERPHLAEETVRKSRIEPRFVTVRRLDYLEEQSVGHAA